MILQLLIAALFLIFIYLKRRYQYWTSRGVYQIEPTWFFGNYGPLLRGESSYNDQITGWYKEIKKKGLKYGGIYMLTRPGLIAVHPDLIKQICVTDFASFNSHGQFTPEGVDPLSDNLFGLAGPKWKEIRAKLTPTFTSGKVKFMFNIIQACTKGLEEMLSEYANDKRPVEIKDILARFTTDVIGNCAFGINCNSMKDPDNDLRTYSKEIFNSDIIMTIKMLLIFNLPQSVLRFIGFKYTKSHVEKFFFKVVEDTVRYREENNVKRDDFMQLLLQLKNRGKLTDDGEFLPEKGNKIHLSMEDLTAQACIFFVAGFETSSTTMTFALLELSQHLDIQENLRNEINEVLKKHNNEVTYDAIQEMKYLEQVINETLRKDSPVVGIPRECTRDCKIIGTDLVIKKGTKIEIPIQGLHSDPEYFEDPDKFDPERFSNENKSKIRPFTYIPFGEGPRICIGLRFAMIQVKTGLISILRNYRLTLNEKTKTPVELDPASFFVRGVKGGVWLNVEAVR